MEKSTRTTENLIASHPFFKGIAPSCLRILNKVAMSASCDATQAILHEGGDADRFYLIHEGTVALETYVPGKGTVTVQILGAGESLGSSWLFPPYRWRFTARPLETTEVTVFDARLLRDHSKENHELGHELAIRVGQVIWQRLQATRALLVDFHGITE